MTRLNALLVAALVAIVLLACAATSQAAFFKAAGKKPSASAAKKKPAEPAPAPAIVETPPPAEAVTPSPADFKTGAEPEGFRDKKWGTPFSEFSDMKDDIGSSLAGHKLSNYTKTGDDLNYCSVTAATIRYIFSDDKLYGVSVEYRNAKQPQWDAVSKGMCAQFGDVPELMLNNNPAYIWWGDKTFVRVKRSLEYIYIDIYSRYFFPGPDTTQDKFERAVQLGDMPNIKRLIASDAGLIKATDDEGKTPVHWSIECHPTGRETEALEFLITKGADVNAKAKNGTTPLQRASQLDLLDTAKLLIGKGADVNLKGWDGETPLISSWLSKNGVAKYLIESGADVTAKDNDGRTALHNVARDGQTDMVRLLISKGADVNARDKDGWSPLHNACLIMSGEDTAKALIDAGADVNAKESVDGKTPLHIAVDNYRDDAVKMLLDNKADVNAKDNKGSTPLKYAEDDDLPKIIELLKQHGGTD